MSIELNKQLVNCKESKIRFFSEISDQLGAEHKMALGEPDFNTPEIIKDATIKAIKENKTRYAETPGLQELREAVSEYEYKHNNVSYDPNEEILITGGSTEALTSALMTMLNPGDEVIVPTPCYTLYKPVIEYCNSKMITLNITDDNFQINYDKLLSKVTNKTKAILLTSPNNPTGVVLNEKSLKNVYDVVKERDIFVICDDVYKELQFGKREIGFSKFQDLKEKIVVCQSFSKPYAMTGFRLGYLLADKSFIEEAIKMHQYLIVCANTFIQYGAIEALKVDSSAFVKEFEKRCNYITKELDKLHLKYPNPDGAFYVWVDIKEFNMTSYDFCLDLIKKEKLAIIPGDCFELEGYIRLSYSISMEEIKICMKLFAKYITSLRSEK